VLLFQGSCVCVNSFFSSLDVEIFERNYPAMIDRFMIRRGSGGAGEYKGGDGVERVIRFLTPVQVFNFLSPVSLSFFIFSSSNLRLVFFLREGVDRRREWREDIMDHRV
jgi:hypothetical protein